MERDSATISKNMSKIHSQDTSIELQLRKALWQKGYRYRKNYKVLPGSPDIVITKHKIAIFCDSEFFHGKDWENDKKLLFLGYTVIHFWGQDIKKHTDECLKVIEETIWSNKFIDENENIPELQEDNIYI